MLGTIAAQRARGLREAAWAYFSLTKPRIIVLLLVTTIPAMVLARGGWPSVWLMLVTVAGGAIVAGGANAMNCYFDRDIDGLMLRTRCRLPDAAGVRQPSGRLPDPGRLRVLRRRLHAAPQADDAPEHRDRGRRRGDAARCRLGGCDRLCGSAGACPVRHRRVVDAAPLLGPGAQLQQRLPTGRRPDAAGRPRPRGDQAPDSAPHHRSGRRHAYPAC